MCPSLTSNYCDSCKSTSYCSTTCQKVDQPVHKLLCGVALPPKIYDYHQPPHPTVYGVMFPAGDSAPVWVAYRGNFAPGQGYKHDQYERYHSNPSHPPVQLLRQSRPPLIVTGNALRSRSRASSTLELYSLTDGPGPGFAVNLSILAVTAQRPGKPWFGPVLAIKAGPPVTANRGGGVHPSGLTIPQYLDMDMIDFRDIVDLLCTHPAISISSMTLSPRTCPAKREITAVRINCPGDQALGHPRFEQVLLRADSAACRSATISAISQLIQHPMRVSRCLPPHDTGYDNCAHNLANPAASELMMCVDPAGAWGFCGAEWVDPAGSVLVVREDGEPLHPQVVEGLCHWCVYVLRPLVRDSVGLGRDPADVIPRETVRERVSKKEWECFYFGFDAWMGEARNVWVKGVWPI